MNKNKINYFNKISKFVVQISQESKEGLQFRGTGFLFADQKNVQKKGNYLPRLITNKHILFNIDENGKIIDKIKYLSLRTNTPINFNEAHQVNRPLDNIEWEWDYHEDPNIDVASILIPSKFEKQLCEVPEDVFFLIEENLIYINSIDEGDEVVFIGFPLGLGLKSASLRDKPIMRKGIIASINRENKTFFIDGFSFSGNSGSPVFLTKKFSGENINSMKLIGIIAGSLEKTIEIGNTECFFRILQNTGLAYAFSSDAINEVIKPPQKLLHN